MICSAPGEDIARLIEGIPEAQFPFLRQQMLRSSKTEVNTLEKYFFQTNHGFLIKVFRVQALTLAQACTHALSPTPLSLVSIVALYRISIAL